MKLKVKLRNKVKQWSKTVFSSSSSSSKCSAQGQILHCKHRNWACSSAKGRSSLTISGTKAAALVGMNRSGSFPLLSAPQFLSLSHLNRPYDIWKDPRGTNVEVRSVDLTNWAIQTSPKFTTGVKDQFHQGFWLAQRFRNNNNNSSTGNYNNNSSNNNNSNNNNNNNNDNNSSSTNNSNKILIIIIIIIIIIITIII